MRWKRFLSVFLYLCWSICAQTQSAQSALSVNESLSRIRSAEAVITPTLVIKNSGAETTAAIRVELLDPEDSVVTTGETRTQLHSGTNEVSIPLHDWNAKTSEWNESIWYRVRYRVIPDQVDQASVEGILALSTKADGIFDLRVVTSKLTVPGMPLRVRVYARSVATLQPMSGVQISAELEGDDENAKLQLNSATNSRGYAQMEFKIPAEGWTSSASLTVVARKGAVIRESNDSVDITIHWRFFVTTDKPIYQPGQIVHVRALLQDWTKHAVVKAPLTFSIEDEDQTLAFRATAETSRFGVARADWEIPENLKLGNYNIKITGSGDDSDTEVGYQSIRISRYDLPTFTVNIVPDRGYYLPGQAAAVAVNADYLFGKPVKSGHVKVVRETSHRWNFKTQKWDNDEEKTWEGETDASGKFTAKIDLSDEHEALRDYDRFRDLDYAAYLTDASTAKTEQRRFRLRISQLPIHLYVIEASNTVGELPLEFFVSASYADGTPAQCEVAIYLGSTDDDKPGAYLRSVRTNRYGVAKVHGLNVPPLPESKVQYSPSARLVLEARDHAGRRGRVTQDFWDASDRLLIQVSTDHALYRPNESVEVDIVTNQKEANLLLDVLREGHILQSQQLRVRNGHAFTVFPYSPDFQGELAIAAYSPLDSDNSWDMPIGTRSILYPHDPALKVTAKFDRATYRPGEDAALDLHVRSSTGAPVEAAVGSVIFDQAVEERARTDAEFGAGRGYGFYDSFGGYWYQPAELGGLKRQDLDQLDVTQPFSDDLQLTAEALLLNRWYADPPLVFGGARYPDALGEAFRQLLAKEVAPVLTALNAAYDKGMNYPRDEASMRRLLAEHNVDFDKVLDPWGSPFRTRFSFERSMATVELISPGPDKRPDTTDDIIALNLQRWYFRPTAEAIKAVMTDYHNRTRGYIRDLATLESELAHAGTDWDALRDPWGLPYVAQFGISNTRYTLTVISGGPDGKIETSSNSDDFPVWTDSSDYFSETAVRIDAALARHFATTQAFPQNEGEFYKVLDDAQIPRSVLVDAWGHPAWIAFDNQARYTDRLIVDYDQLTGQPQTTTQPETTQFAFIHIYSPGANGIPHSGYDFELANFSREITRQNSLMTEPAAAPSTMPLSGGSGAITGVVTDPTGAVVAGVKVTALLYDRISFDATTDSSGRYTLRNLPTGSYTVTVNATGFQGLTVNHIPVKSLATTELNLRLQVGATSECVEVAAEAITLQTTSSEVSSVANPRTGAGPISTPRLRQFFPETLLWEPMLETDARGNSRLHFKFADSITNWKLSLVASTIDGQIGLLDASIKTFQPFFLEHEPPQVLTQGDEIALPVVLRNYLDKPQALRVEMKTEPWFNLVSPAVREASVAAGDSERESFRFRVTGPIGDVKQRVTAANRETGDAVEKPVRIHPDGEPRTATFSRLFSARSDLDLEIPDYALPGSVQAEIKIYPNLMAHVLESTRSLLERPYGCGEQTVSSTYPNVMLLRLYKHAGKQPDDAYRTALHFTRLGYARLLTYQHNDGGISVWAHDDPDVALTAYALHFLIDASEFIEIDTDVIESVQKFLLTHQNTSGTWRERYRNEDSVTMTAYVALALSRSSHSAALKSYPVAGPNSLEPAITRALDYLRKHWSSSNDPYEIAQVSRAAFESNDKTLLAAANARLRSMAHREGDSSYWTLESNTLFYGWGTPGRVETTALAVQALTNDVTDDKTINSADRDLVSQGLIFLIKNKDAYGAWYSGQTTINVLEAFLLLATPPAEGHKETQVAEVLVNGEKAGTIQLPGPYEVIAPLELDLTKSAKPGVNHISISRSGESQTASVQAVARYYIPWDKSSAKAGKGFRSGDSDALALRVSYDHTQAHPEEEIHCKVHAERVGFRGYGMLLAEIGLPPGAEVDRASLEKEMVENWTISQYEIRPDRLVVYFWAKAGGSDFDFTFRARYSMNALTAPSVLYDYYNPDAQVVVQPTRIEIE